MENIATLPENIDRHWTVVAPLLVIRNEDDYDGAVERLNGLLDQVGTDETHPLYNLLDTLGTLIEAYEEEHHYMPQVTASETLEYLMAEHGLNIGDLPAVGSAEEIEAILNQEQCLTLPQIKRLADRFSVDYGVFID